MKRMGLKKAILAVLAAAITTVSLLAWAPPAEAQVAPLNAVVGIFRVFNALNRRNRVYRAAHDAQQDFNAYYSSLQDTARGQLLSGELSSLRQGEDGPERSRAAAYIRMSAALQAEQAAITRAIDAETNQARRDFNRALVRELQSVVTQLPGARQILGAVRAAISNIRSTMIALQTAAASGQPFEALTQRLVEQVSASAALQDQVRNLGSALGSGLNRAMGGALMQVNHAIEDVSNEASQAIQLLDTMDAQAAELDLSGEEMVPYEAGIGPVSVQLTDRATAVLDVASQALAFLTATQRTGGITREQLYQQIRTDLLNQRNAALLSAAMHVSNVVCQQVDRSAYEAAAGILQGSSPASADSAGVAYYACTNQDTGQPIGAWMAGPTYAEETTEEPTEDAPKPEETQEVVPQETEAAWGLEAVDWAGMIDVSSTVTNSYNNDYQDYCFAEIDLMNAHPTDTLLFVCEDYSYFNSSGEAFRRATGRILEPGEVITYDNVRSVFEGTLLEEEYLVRCVAYRRTNADGDVLPEARWIGDTYGPYDLAIFESGLTIFEPPNPCAR